MIQSDNDFSKSSDILGRASFISGNTLRTAPTSVETTLHPHDNASSRTLGNPSDID